ncbi:hypothetical protein L7F22_032932 [Adiantum nelumboides]|nr:hypothetical protein [Adiantum nelumboides]
MTGDSSWLHDYKPIQLSMEVRLGDDGAYMAEGMGTVHLKLPTGDVTKITGVYYIPGLAKNLLSVSEVTKSGTSIEFFHKYCIIKASIPNQTPVRLICPQKGRLYPLGISAMPSVMHSNSAISQADANLETLRWHYRLGHPHVRAMKTLQMYKMVKGMTLSLSNIDLCEACIFGKMTCTKFPRSRTKTSKVLELVHSDVFRTLPVPSLTGHKYVVLFLDDYSKYAIIYFMKHKSEVFQHFKHYHTFVERHTTHRLQTLRSDNGGEYVSHEFRDYCLDLGIVRQFSVPHTPQQNGLAERKWGTLFNAARSMMQVAGLSQSFWEEATATACYLQNRMPSKTLPNVTPYQRWTNEKPDLTHVRIFGTPCYSLIPAEARTKLDPRAERCILMGYGERFGVKAYRLYNPTTFKFVFSGDVMFNEDALLSAPFTPTTPDFSCYDKASHASSSSGTPHSHGRLDADADTAHTSSFEESSFPTFSPPLVAAAPPTSPVAQSPGVTIAGIPTPARNFVFQARRPASTRPRRQLHNTSAPDVASRGRRSPAPSNRANASISADHSSTSAQETVPTVSNTSTLRQDEIEV